MNDITFWLFVLGIVIGWWGGYRFGWRMRSEHIKIQAENDLKHMSIDSFLEER